ncbi:MAG: flagellar motor protein MotA [Hyphomicrobiales bacterium]|nr:flagellar motor protein MotA [Hyphomicrobiales bacterium]
MTRPGRYLVRMILFIVVVGGVCVLFLPPLRDAFLTNAPLNGLILGVLLLGILYNLRQVIRLWPAVNWLEHFQSGRPTALSEEPPQLLAPMATMIGERKGRLTLSAPAMRTLLDGIFSRLDESRELSRYTIGLLIFLGLLGTFWGLLQTVSSIGDVIGGLSVEGGDTASIFTNLKQGLQAPIAGMGTAFSSSLFGLAGSLVLGFLDLQAGQAQNRFYNDLEEWLSTKTRLSSGSLGTDGEQPVPAYLQALLEQTADSLENLQLILSRGEEGRIATHNQIAILSERIGSMTDQMRTEQNLMMRLAESQSEVRPLLTRLADSMSHMSDAASVSGIDDATRAHIRNLELYVARIGEELTTGREEVIRHVRSDIKLLARTIAAVAEEPDHRT